VNECPYDRDIDVIQAVGCDTAVKGISDD